MRYYLQPGLGEAAGLSVVSPPCKQVTHRSPSQSGPGRTPASRLCASTRFEIQTPAQKVTRVAGLVHHILSLGPDSACASALLLQAQEGEGRKQVTQLRQEFSLALVNRALAKTLMSLFRSFTDCACALRRTRRAPRERGAMR